MDYAASLKCVNPDNEVSAGYPKLGHITLYFSEKCYWEVLFARFEISQSIPVGVNILS